jgi:hypothetical protein
VQVDVAGVDAALFEVGQDGVAGPVQRAGRRPTSSDVVLSGRVGDGGVGQVQPLQGDHAGIDSHRETLPVRAGNPTVQAVELGQHGVSRGPASGVVDLDRLQPLECGRQRVAVTPQQGEREVHPVAGLEQKLVAARGADQRPTDEAVRVAAVGQAGGEVG